jgi:hypothetical protein
VRSEQRPLWRWTAEGGGRAAAGGWRTGEGAESQVGGRPITRIGSASFGQSPQSGAQGSSTGARLLTGAAATCDRAVLRRTLVDFTLLHALTFQLMRPPLFSFSFTGEFGGRSTEQHGGAQSTFGSDTSLLVSSTGTIHRATRALLWVSTYIWGLLRPPPKATCYRTFSNDESQFPNPLSS